MVTSSTLSPQTDEELLALIKRSQDHAAFGELVKRHAGRFRALAYRFTHSMPDAEDIVQDAFAALWVKPYSFNAFMNARFSTWFYRIIVNRCLDLARKKKPNALPEDFEGIDNGMLADEALILDEKTRLVEKAFRSLSKDMQTALNLSFYDPVPNKDGAKIMGLSLKAFQSLVIRAKNALKDKVLFAMQHERTQRYG